MRYAQSQPFGDCFSSVRRMRAVVKLLVRRRNVAQRLASDRRGATIVEFAIVSPLLIALLFGLFETSLTFFIQESLETVAEEALRSSVTKSYLSLIHI